MSSTPTARYFRTLAGHTIVFGLSTLVRPLSQLLLVRLYTNTHFLAVDDYAAWTLFQMALNIGVVVLNMGLATTFFRFYLLAETEEEKRRITGRIFRLTVTIAIIGGGLLYLFGEVWARLLIGQGGLGAEAGDIALAVFGNTLSIVPLALLRAEGRWKPYAAFNILRFFALIALNAWFLIGVGLHLRGITLALAVTNIFIALLFLPVLRGRMVSERFSAGWRKLLRYGAPLVAIDVTLYLLNGIPRILLNELKTAPEVALFGFALQLAFIAQVSIVMPFTVAFGPQLFRARRDLEDPRPLYARTMGYVWSIGAAVALLVTLFAPELASLLGKDPFYRTAAREVMPLAFSVAFYGIFIVFSSGASLKDKTWTFPVILFVSCLVEGVLAKWWINGWGYSGAAWATFAGYAALAALTLAVNQAYYPIRFPWGRVVRVAGVTAAIILYHRLTPAGDTLLTRFVLVVLFPLLLLLTGYLDDGERKALKRWIGKRGNRIT